jgi:hypothetical protein
MRKLALAAVSLTLILGGLFAMYHRNESRAGDDKGPKLAHMVYFTLKDNSPEAKKKLVEACKKYLTKHEGEIYFAAGTLADSLKREVNVRDWDVGLHIVFANMKAHDAYQSAKRHDEFIAENKDNWKQVRVFDSLVE